MLADKHVDSNQLAERLLVLMRLDVIDDPNKTAGKGLEQEAKFVAGLRKEVNAIRQTRGLSQENIDLQVNGFLQNKFKEIIQAHAGEKKENFFDPEAIQHIGQEGALAGLTETVSSLGDPSQGLTQGFGHIKTMLFNRLINLLSIPQKVFGFITTPPDDKKLGILDGDWWAQKWNNAQKNIEQSKRESEVAKKTYGGDVAGALLSKNNQGIAEIVKRIEEEQAAALPVSQPKQNSPQSQPSQSSPSVTGDGGAVTVTVEPDVSSVPITDLGDQVRAQFPDMQSEQLNQLLQIYDALDGNMDQHYDQEQAKKLLDKNNDGRIQGNEFNQMVQVQVDKFDELLKSQPSPSNGAAGTPSTSELGNLPKQGLPVDPNNLVASFAK